MHDLGQVLLSEAVALCRHTYGNYVIQHLLLHGSAEHRSRFVSIVVQQIRNTISDAMSTGVINTAFEVCDVDQRLNLALAVCSVSGILTQLAQRRRGHLTVRHVLEILPRNSTELDSARTQLMSARGSLSQTRYGRSVLRFCEQESSEGACDSLSPQGRDQ